MKDCDLGGSLQHLPRQNDTFMFRRLIRFWLLIILLASFTIPHGRLNLARAAGGVISGRVFDQLDLPLDSVQVLSHDGIEFRVDTTNFDGIYSLTDVPVGVNHLQASSDGSGLSYAHYWNFTVAEGGSYLDINFNLRPGGGTISGRVVDGNGDAVPNATFHAFEQTAQGYNNGAWATTSADSNGYFATSSTDAPGPGLPTGTFAVKASKSGLPDALIYNVPVTAGLDTEVTLTILSGSGSISGRITDAATGSGISSAEVFADNGAVQVTTYTDADGYYLAENLPGSGYNVVVSKPGYASAHQYSVVVMDGEETSDVDFGLTTHMGQISGRVTDSNGDPIVGATLLADSDQGTGFGSTTTDGNGDYTLTNLAPMQYYVHASAQGYGNLIRIENVENGVTTTNVNFILGVATGGLSGRVTKDGQPASLANIFVNSSGGSSEVFYGNGIANSNGDYSVGNLPPGNYDVHVYAVPGYTSQIRFNVSVGSSVVTGIDFDLTNGTSEIFGHVTDAGTGTPLEGVKVQVFLTENPGTWGDAYTDSNGDYIIGGLWDGQYNIYVNLVGYPQVTKSFVYVPDTLAKRVDIEMGLDRALEARPDAVIVMVEGVFGTWRSALIDVTAGGIADWTAETAAPWLYLGPSGIVHTDSGQTGDSLILRFDPSVVGYGTYNTVVTLTSPDANGTTIDVEMMKVITLHEVFFSLILR